MLASCYVFMNMSLMDFISLIIIQHDVDGKAYYTFEFVAQAPNYTRHALSTICIGNGMELTLIGRYFIYTPAFASCLAETEYKYLKANFKLNQTRHSLLNNYLCQTFLPKQVTSTFSQC